jgi:hypothetical protein
VKEYFTVVIVVFRRELSVLSDGIRGSVLTFAGSLSKLLRDQREHCNDATLAFKAAYAPLPDPHYFNMLVLYIIDIEIIYQPMR